MVTLNPLPKLYKRYVDDIFVMFWSRDYVKRFVDYMNTKHPKMRFTFEIEQDSFSFLDEHFKLLKHQFIEKTFSGIFTKFKSFIPMT